MHDCNPKKSKGETAAISTPFTLFTPRQVILKSMSNMNTKPLISLSEEQRKLLLQSICQFLQQNGFSNSLKKLHKEADVEKESWKSCSLNLEEMCYQFLKSRDDAKVNDEAIKDKATIHKDGSINGVVSVEKENEGDNSEVEDHPVDDVELKHKKKKKSKKSSYSSTYIAEETDSKPSENTEEVSLSAPSEPIKKSKDKKKKKKKHTDESQEKKKEDNLDELPTGEASDKSDVTMEEKKEKSKSKKKKEDTLNSNFNGSLVEAAEVEKEKKSSKKRKKSISDEKETDSLEKVDHDGSKRRKTENLDESNETILPQTPNVIKGLVNGETEESQKKDKKKLQNGSAEPRTSANAFRRVKEEEVEFVDERLQDNSYWAKDGAEVGYGAKAQEVLGQVRGRDFRHEKTKKKRGSYRGGQIDLQSHSVKFNYDDEE